MKTPCETNFLSQFLIWGVRVYQRCVDGRPTPCRFVPTCSDYAVEAFERHGSIRGSMLTVRRLVRCNPWGDQGWDPVPRDKIDAPPSPRGTPCST